MKIRFTESRWLDTEDRTKVPKFKKGSTHDLPEASAYRWTRRGYAVYVVADVPPTLKLDRPMMGEARAFKPAEIAKVFSVGEPAEKPAEKPAKKPAKPPKKAKPKRKPKGA